MALSVVSPEGREQRLRLIESGEMFGELCFCDVRARQEQAIVLEEGELLAVEMDAVLTAVLSSTEATSAFLGTLCGRIGDAEAQVRRLAFNTVPERIGLGLALGGRNRGGGGGDHGCSGVLPAVRAPAHQHQPEAGRGRPVSPTGLDPQRCWVYPDAAPFSGNSRRVRARRRRPRHIG